MRRRYLEEAVKELCFPGHKMAFISGPRQVGKTTMAKQLLSERGAGAYHNWDDVTFRRTWTKDPKAAIPQAAGATPLVVLDEIHKARQWKRSIKGIYDTLARPADIIVTGSARLAVYRKGSDSLVGRYHHFRLHPFSMAELHKGPIPDPDQLVEAIFSRARRPPSAGQSDLDALMRFGGFPEPFLSANDRKANLWRRSRIERVIREDLRDLTRIPELSRIEMLASLIPERVGAPLSRAALREILEVSFDTTRRWLASLDELFYLFEIKPWQKATARSLKKDGKAYLWDWSEVPDAAARFENLVASHLLKLCHYYSDAGYGDFHLWCLRTKDGHEIDFLITRDHRPWLPVEVKYTDVAPSSSWLRFLSYLPGLRGIQVVRSPGYWRVHELAPTRLLVASAAEVLGYLV